MATRLDRLFLLLETGSTPVIRKSAAEQLGEVQKLHPHEFHNLITKVHTYLGSTSWETRIAAGQAIEAIARNVPQWEPVGAPKQEEAASASPQVGRLVFSQFNIQRVLQNGASLLGSEGAEYDVAEESFGLDSKERLSQQKQLLNKRLGLDVAAGLGIASDDLFHEDDLIIQRQASNSPSRNANIADLVTQQLQGSSSQLSAREKNRAKRRAKLLAKQVSHDPDKKATNGDGSDEEPPNKMRKTSSVVVEAADGKDNKILLDNVPDKTMNLDEMDEWPFESFCEVLMNDLFHSTWEKRHGAATGLREVLKLHGKGAAKTVTTPSNMMDVENEHWLEDLSLRLICVMALDRFGDFIADEVVAPVRETCAQTLGTALQYMSVGGVCSVVNVLLQLLQQVRWEVRHGGLLGIKYALAVRQDAQQDLLPTVLPAVFLGLQDSDDDVRAVSAAALLPVTDTIIASLPDYVSSIVQCLWGTLLDLDDLTASTNSIMSLLSTLLSHPKVHPERVCQESLAGLVPRLWPFLRHNIPSVRRASLNTLYTLLTQQEEKGWLLQIFRDASRHLVQRALLEPCGDLLLLVYQTWCALVAAFPADHLLVETVMLLGPWMCLMMQPAHLAYDPAHLIEAKHKPKEQTTPKKAHLDGQQAELKAVQDYIGGWHGTGGGSLLERDQRVMRARLITARLLGLLCSKLSTAPTPPGGEDPNQTLANLLLFYLGSKSALQRLAVGLVVMQWAALQQPCSCPESLRIRLTQCLTESLYFDEIAMSFTKMQTECRNFLASLKQQDINFDDKIPPGSLLTLEQAHALTGEMFDSVLGRIKPKQQQTFTERRGQVALLVSETAHDQQVLSTRVQASMSGVLVTLHRLPEKFNPIIRPLMDSLKKEENAELQELCAQSMSQLLEQSLPRTPCPNAKVVKNLCSALCADCEHTPVITPQPAPTKKGKSSSTTTQTDASQEVTHCDTYSGILTLNAQQKAIGHEKVGPGRRPAHLRRSTSFTLRANTNLNITMDTIANEEDEVRRQILVQRRGATVALTTITRTAGPNLPTRMESLWEIITTKTKYTIRKPKEPAPTVEEAQELVHHLQVLETVCASVHPDLHDQLLAGLDSLCACLEHPYTAVRHMAARALGMLSKVVTSQTMNVVLERVLPLLGASHSETKRQGAIETIANLLDQLGVDIVPYLVLLVVPVMGQMSDQDAATRLTATHCFATLIRLIPLESGIPDPPAMSAVLSERKERERRFLEQLLDGSKLDNYPIPVPVKAELRKYQQDGVNWLWFLNRYKLHGILCDDMGLGKTLQSICILAGDFARRAKEHEETESEDTAPLPSIVVCPPTLTGHWVYEVEHFVSQDHLNPLHYTGPPSERQRLQKRVKKHNLVVASYDVVRNDIDFFGSIHWNYCILDEGHIIKNSKTKLSKAVKQLRSNHRLILSGTPIQNNVLELWSLFDFLMPGFLGTEKQFQARYGRPILQSRDAKSSTKEQEAGALAMEALHRQVLPFLLRRMKEDVLKDLPPKIIQDYYCDLSPLQVQLYEDFAKSRAKKTVDDTLTGATPQEEKLTNRSHIFQALQYLRKACNHPALVLTPNHPQYEAMSAKLVTQGSSLHDINHAPKLTALKQLLLDCGIGLTGPEATNAPVVNQHRVLLFCQLKAMLDIVEKDLLKCQMPTVTFLRLDGSVPAGSRIGIVNRFNNDPSIDVLLLTTHVGGLGLNLTGADTVVFVEHDWNPMKDLQAMDRAHRIGQKKVVNVYRLITRGTLEEKIMGLQKFKMNIANTVINQENASMASMGTDQLLDLFTLEAGDTRPTTGAAASGSRTTLPEDPAQNTMKAVLENLGELWDEKQYETEYDMGSFLKSLSK